MNVPSHQTIIVNSNDNSGIGTAGLAFSILGWLTCGILCPIGALLSFFGLFCRGSKSHAIAGLLVGFPGVIFLVTVGFGIVASMLGIGAITTAAISEASRNVERKRMAESEVVSIAPVVDDEPADSIPPVSPPPSTTDVETPTVITTQPPESESTNETIRVAKQAEVDKAAEDDKKLRSAAERRRERAAAIAAATAIREWTSRDGKFKTNAKFISRGGNKITIEKEDGKQVTLDLDKLSEADNQYVKDL